jgi:hypothetical protein
MQEHTHRERDGERGGGVVAGHRDAPAVSDELMHLVSLERPQLPAQMF